MQRGQRFTLPFVILLFLPWPGYSGSESANLETRAGWVKAEANPVLGGALGTCFDVCVLKDEGKFRMWFSWRPKKSVALVESADGISGWERHPANPIISPGKGKWDHEACYKPFALFDDGKWLLWYNGRRGHVEQIGMATHLGEELGF